jgi:very-short-patch-repair endonuclease
MPRQAEKIAFVCQGCGASFQLNPGDVARGRGKYCSRTCYREVRAAEWVEIACASCSKAVSVRRNYVERGQYKYCSDDCRRNCKSSPAERHRVCIRCGKEFTVKGKLTKQRLHCSLACRTRQVTKRCEGCGNNFQTNAKGGRLRFCSRSCYLISKESTLQRDVRTVLDIFDIRYEREKSVGRYNVDFYLADYQAVLEVDGEYWHDKQALRERDGRREETLRSQGWRVFHVLGQRVRAVGVIAAVREVLDAISM